MSAQRVLELAFHHSMTDVYRKAKSVGYDAHAFFAMVAQMGGLKAAKQLLAGPEEQSGFTRLWELHHIEWSVEAQVHLDRFRGLFTPDELAEAESRILKYSPSFFEEHRRQYVSTGRRRLVGAEPAVKLRR
jgi:hypothetical protein